ncbi:unnamed protein product [Linum trigynum]|uniref:Prohibitin n=1 Tax=Linum trigynum TaxID=586398 RepID=A0AAV2FZ14_9ROSI
MSVSTAYSLHLYGSTAGDVIPFDPTAKLVVALRYRYQLQLPTREGVNVQLDDVTVPEVRRGFKFPPDAFRSASLRKEFVSRALRNVIGGGGTAEDESAREELAQRISSFAVETAAKYGMKTSAVVAVVGVNRVEVVGRQEVVDFLAGHQRQQQQKTSQQQQTTLA